MSLDLVEEGGVPLDLSDVGVTSKAGLLIDDTVVVGGAEFILGWGRGKMTDSSDCGGVVESGRGCRDKNVIVYADWFSCNLCTSDSPRLVWV